MLGEAYGLTPSTSPVRFLKLQNPKPSPDLLNQNLHLRNQISGDVICIKVEKLYARVSVLNLSQLRIMLPSSSESQGRMSWDMISRVSSTLGPN